jgi:hypothetical protein
LIESLCKNIIHGEGAKYGKYSILSCHTITCLEQDFSEIDFAAEKKVGCTVTACAALPLLRDVTH